MTPPRITPSEVEVAQAVRTALPNGIGLYTLASVERQTERYRMAVLGSYSGICNYKS